MADRTQQILPGGQSSAPYTYTLPASTAFELLAVRAILDGTAAGGAFLPCVQLWSDAGQLMAQRVGSSVAAGGSADVTFAPFLGGDTTPCAIPDTFFNMLLVSSPDALWKLNETSGVTAFDSLAGHHDASVVGSAPTWNAITSPTGDPAIYASTNQGFGVTPGAWPPTMSGDFTVAVLYRTGSDTLEEIIGQSQPQSTHIGWQLIRRATFAPGGWGMSLTVGTGASANETFSTFPIVKNTWYWIAVTHASGVFTMYVNAAADSATYSGSYSATGSRVWVGYGGTNFGQTNDSYYSYATWWMTRALTAGELGAIYATL
jgi:hypothetical protein